MAKQTARHPIHDGLYIYQQDNSKYWYARFVIDGEWYSKATKKTDKQEAIHRALELLSEYRLMVKHDISIPRIKRATKYLFPNVADLAIQRMESELSKGTGKVSYEIYIQSLNKYHKIFFAETSILDIDRKLLQEFDAWRISQLGRVPAKSTILTHNAAFNRVFDEAIIQTYMVASQRPDLNNTGVVSERRASFTEEEFDRLVDKAYDFVRNARTKKSKMIRELLVDYMVVAANTGIRPGTEMENILWGDISIGRKKRAMTLYINVRKGKTTSYTGTRKVVCRDNVLVAFLDLRDTFPDRKPTDKVFILRDGTETKQLGKAFTRLLKETEMQYNSEGPRTLYSLRHSYITWQLKADVSPHVLAKQCGTSIKMLEEYYSHVVPEMFTNMLSGYRHDDYKDELIPPDPELDQEELDLTKSFIDEWEAEHAERGCI